MPRLSSLSRSWQWGTESNALARSNNRQWTELRLSRAEAQSLTDDSRRVTVECLLRKLCCASLIRLLDSKAAESWWWIILSIKYTLTMFNEVILVKRMCVNESEIYYIAFGSILRTSIIKPFSASGGTQTPASGITYRLNLEPPFWKSCVQAWVATGPAWVYIAEKPS